MEIVINYNIYNKILVKQIKYSPELLNDLNNLIRDFLIFMTFNLIHADQGLNNDCKIAVKQLIRFSLDNSKQFSDFFKQPVLKYEKENKLKLVKNIANIIRFFYDYINYAEKILKTCKPDIYQKRFFEIRKNYNKFRAKYQL